MANPLANFNSPRLPIRVSLFIDVVGVQATLYMNLKVIFSAPACHRIGLGTAGRFVAIYIFYELKFRISISNKF